VKAVSARLLVWLALLPPVVWAQARIVGTYDLERSGIHHVDVDGRVVSARGALLAGIRVWLQPPGGRNSAVYRETRTDSQGRFRFLDVGGTNDLNGVVDPSPEWIPATFTLTGVDGGESHAGDIRVAANTTLRVALETAPGVPFRGDPGTVNVDLVPKGTSRTDVRQVYANGIFTFDYITYREAELSIAFHGTTYRAPLHFEPGQRNRFVVARPGIAKKDGERFGALEILEMVRPADPPSFETRGGVVRAPDGSPLEGAVVSILGDYGPGRIGRPSSAVTGPDGRYRIVQPLDRNVFSTTVGLVAENAWESDERVVHDIRLANAIHLELGADVPQASAAAQPRVRWWHDALGWQTLRRLDTWVAPESSGGPAKVFSEDPYASLVADLPGYFPIALRLKLPKAGGGPAPRVEHRFRFTDSPVRTLEVRSLGKPLAGASVDLVRVDGQQELATDLLATYTTGADGRLQLVGAPEGVYAVFVYARGHAPAHAVWNPGAPLNVTLAPANAALEVEGAIRGQLVSVRPVGGTNPAAVARVTQTPLSFTLAPGDYEIAAMEDSGRLAGADHVSAAAGRATRVFLAAPKFPEIRVEFPDGRHEWEVTAWHLATGESPADSPWLDGEPQSAQVAVGEQTATLHLSDSGLYRVWVRQSGARFELRRTIEVAGGSRVVWKVPSGNASLTGNARSAITPDMAQEPWKKGVGLWLANADAGGWDVMVLPAELPGDGGFRIDGLPAGRYYAWQHLYAPLGPPDNPFEGPFSDVCGKHVRGGAPVVLAAGRAETLKDLAALPTAAVSLHVIDAGGKPVSHATVFVRDWSPETSGRGQEMFERGAASRPLIVPVTGGSAKVPDVRAGGLEFELLLDSGRVYTVVGEVDPGRPLEIRLPKEAR
jgi:hypothetical protein